MHTIIRKGLRNPDKILPYLRNHSRKLIGGIPSEIGTYRASKLPKQQELIDKLRETEDWLLIILDACRYDYFEEVVNDYIETDAKRVFSPAHDTFEYLQRVWPGWHDVTYVSGAVPINSERLDFEGNHLEGLYNGYQPTEHIARIEDVWRKGWDPSLGTCPPEPVTERAIACSPDVVHYQQPHSPFIGEKRELGHTNTQSPRPGKGEPVDKPIWERVQNNKITDKRLHEVYRSNLHRVLPEVAYLINEIGDEYGRIVVTSDHGEALGEYGIYAHPRWPSHPKVRIVPWAEVEGVKNFDRSSIPNRQEQISTDEEMDVTERLAALGYREE